MIYQLFHQHKTTGKLVLAGQSEDIVNAEQMKAWERFVAKDMPPPDGCQWLTCNTKSKYFDHKATLIPV